MWLSGGPSSHGWGEVSGGLAEAPFGSRELGGEGHWYPGILCNQGVSVLGS